MRRPMNATSKAFQTPTQVWDNVDSSTQQISDPVDISGLDNINVEFLFQTTSSEGVFYIDVSLTGAVGSYAPLQLRYIPIIAAADGVVQLDLNQLSHQFMRFRYEPDVAGTGTISAWYGGKGVGS